MACKHPFNKIASIHFTKPEFFDFFIGDDYLSGSELETFMDKHGIFELCFCLKCLSLVDVDEEALREEIKSLRSRRAKDEVAFVKAAEEKEAKDKKKVIQLGKVLKHFKATIADIGSSSVENTDQIKIKFSSGTEHEVRYSQKYEMWMVIGQPAASIKAQSEGGPK